MMCMLMLLTSVQHVNHIDIHVHVDIFHILRIIFINKYFKYFELFTFCDTTQNKQNITKTSPMTSK